MLQSQHAVGLADVYVTEALADRPRRAPDYLAEKLALQDLARQLIDRPGDVLPRLVDLALELTGALSGGLSLYEAEPAPGRFRWQHLRGAFMRFEGETTPREFSPCGICLDRGAPLLAQHPERYYAWIRDAGLSVPEVLLVPLYIDGVMPLGTLWVVAGVAGHFDSGHSRVLTELAAFAGMALRILRTEAKLQQALEQQELLTREMAHRVKNLFAVTNGMVQIAARSASTLQEMARILTGRLTALADSHALVRRSFAEDGQVTEIALLGDLLKTVLRPHEAAATEEGKGRFEIDGPPVQLGQRATNGLALLFHELATNAAKYGALSAPRGAVRVAWERTDDSLDVRWQESGGPALAGVPGKTGFGASLARGTIEGQLGGAIAYDWHPAGVAIAISVPLRNLIA